MDPDRKSIYIEGPEGRRHATKAEARAQVPYVVEPFIRAGCAKEVLDLLVKTKYLNYSKADGVYRVAQ